MKKPSTATIIRTAILAVTIVNEALTIAGKSPLPFTNEEITETVSFLAMAGASITAWWKNNSFTQAAIKADETFK